MEREGEEGEAAAEEVEDLVEDLGWESGCRRGT